MKRLSTVKVFRLVLEMCTVAIPVVFANIATAQARTLNLPILIRSNDVNVLMADRATRSPSLQDYIVWGSPIGRAWVKNWKQPSEFLQWQVIAPEAGEYQVSVLATSTAGAKAEVSDAASRLPVSIPAHWDKVTLAAPLRLPKGRSTVTIRLLQPGDAALKSLELIDLRNLQAIQFRINALRASTQWLSNAKYGLMFQWGGWGYPQHGPAKPWCRMIQDFNVETFADMVEETGAGYVIWSVTWSKYLFPAPIKAIDAIAPGHTCSRDLIADLATALNKRDIKLMLYYHAGHDTPDFWSKTWDPSDPDKKKLFVRNVEAIFTEVGRRYGSAVAGWFIDDGMLYYPAPFEQITKAAKAGNRNRLVSYNSWILPRLTDFQDVYMGEGFRGNDATPLESNGIFPDGPQKGLFAQGMFVLDGPDWGINKPDEIINPPVLSPTAAITLVKNASSRGQTLSFDLLMYEDGSVSPASLEVLHALRKAIRGK